MRTETLILAPDTTLTCPNCSTEFSLEQGFARQALESIEASSHASLEQLRERERELADRRAQQMLAAREAAARQASEELETLMKEQAERHAQSIAQVRTLTEQSFKAELEALRDQLRTSQSQLVALEKREALVSERERSLEARVQEAAATRAAELLAGERQSYERQLADSREQVRTLRVEQLQLREERQRLKDERDALGLEVRKQVDSRMAQRESQIRAQEQERASLEKTELLKTIDAMKEKLAEATRKADQGSQQLQGEVLETTIEDALLRSFPLDVFEPVKQGARGADVIQRVMADGGRIAGTLLWEMKRARDFSPAWVAKLKEEMRTSGADAAVLVTMPSATPKDWGSGQAFAVVDGIWVCINTLALQLAAVLRLTLLDVYKQRLISAGKGEKMEAVYDYVTSVQFGQKVRAVYDTFRVMREELESERNVTQQRWARREKQLQAGISSLLGLGGEIQGLAQQPLPALELEEEPE
jgi:hypothetical protein